MKGRRKIELFLLYLLLTAGGVWHLLGWFQTLMRFAAAPLLMALSILLLAKMLSVHRGQTAAVVIWSLVVFVGGFLFETIGVKTGLVFGQYEYGDVLQPQIAGVPLAIGFAWLGIQISSLAVVQMFSRKLHRPYFIAGLTALLMVAFDVLMEPAAVYLGYWTWVAGPPLHNYLGWFVISLLFSLLGARMRLFETRLPSFARHAFLAQMIYFILIFLKSL